MAVVQISRIQHRRGRASAGTGLPQLASGELGWAIDTQELFIGNGSVSEGAPYVGNTKVITEHDNILDLALQYQYKRTDATIQTGPSSAQPIQRSLQLRLDEIVYASSFGALGDGVADDTAALQRAIDQLFLNDATKGSTASRIILNIEAGEYKITEPLRIPPHANIRGAGKDKTVIRQEGNFPVLQTVNSTSTPGTYKMFADIDSLTQPQFIELSGMTLQQTVPGYSVVELYSTKDSQFNNMKLTGTWSYPSDDPNTDTVKGIELIALSYDVTCEDNSFNNIDFEQLSYAVDSTYDIEYNDFESCSFVECGYGIRFGNDVDGITTGKLYGPANNSVEHCRFYRISKIGFDVQAGTGNKSESNHYTYVGNDGGNEGTPAYNIINFGESGNVSTSDYFERSKELTSNPAYLITVPYVSEVSGKVKMEHKYNTEITLQPGTVNSPLIRLPANESISHIVHYYYKSQEQSITRHGTMHINVDRTNDEIHISDDSSVIGNSANFEKLVFSATLEDADVDTNIDTVYVRYTNTVATENGTFSYWYESLS